jgi:hypothetical protein
MKKALWVGVLAALVGCAGAGPTPEQEAAKRETIEDILSQPLAADAYAEEERCLSSRAYNHVDVLDDQHVLFKGSGDKLWLNKLRNRCVGLRSHDILRFKMRDNRVCDLDTFEGVSSFMWNTSSGICSLGKFTPVTSEQVEAIELAVKESRKN